MKAILCDINENSGEVIREDIEARLCWGEEPICLEVNLTDKFKKKAKKDTAYTLEITIKDIIEELNKIKTEKKKK